MGLCAKLFLGREQVLPGAFAGCLTSGTDQEIEQQSPVQLVILYSFCMD